MDDDNHKVDVPVPDVILNKLDYEANNLYETANLEHEYVNVDDLEKKARHNDHLRSERKKSFLWWISIIITIFVVLGICLLGVIWFIHLAFPNWRWMPQDDLAKIETILFSTIISSITSHFIKDHLSN